MVSMAGVEPARREALPPQGSVSTNFTTSTNLLLQEAFYCLGKSAGTS